VGVHPADGRHERTLLQRALYGGFGATLAQAFEMAVTTLIFALGGLWLDARLGTTPAFTVGLSALVFVYVSWRAVWQYKARVEAEEEGKPWTRRRAKTSEQP